MNRNLLQYLDIWNKCLTYNIEQKPEEYLELIDLLVTNNKTRNILEIGSNYAGTTCGFCQIANKVYAVDIHKRPNLERLSQEFSNLWVYEGDSHAKETIDTIRSLGVKFDCIFIDGDHSYEGVKQDFESYMEFLAEDGIVAFHDIIGNEFMLSLGCNVHDFWHEIKSDYNSMEFIGNGVEAEFDHNDEFLNMMIQNHPYDSWGGIGVIKKEHIAVFSHNYLAPDWELVVDEQLTKLKSSGLYKRADEIYYCFYSDTEVDSIKFLGKIKQYDTEQKITVVRHAKNDYELRTLALLQTITKDRGDYVLYYHTKGLTANISHGNVNPRDTTSWRHLLEYFNIECWRDCISLARTYDTVGALYVKEHYEYRYYYSGNFWWAKSAHIRKLPNIMRIYSGDRTICEMWLGKTNHTWFNMFDYVPENFYITYFDENWYRTKV